MIWFARILWSGKGTVRGPQQQDDGNMALVFNHEPSYLLLEHDVLK